MEAFKIDRKSLHYRLANYVGSLPLQDDGTTDICSYVRSMLKSVFVICFLLLIFGCLAGLVIHTVLGIVFSFYFGTFIFTEIGMVGFGISIVLTAFITFLWLAEKIKYWAENRREERWRRAAEEKPDGFVKTAYKSWKEKYCMRVTFTGETND